MRVFRLSSGGHFSCENLVLDVITKSGLGPVAFYTVPRVCRLADKLDAAGHRADHAADHYSALVVSSD